MTAEHTYPDIEMLIDGEWIGVADRERLPVENPADLSTLGEAPAATPEDLERATAAAARAFETWRTTSPHRRVAILMRAAELLRERADELGVAGTLENGKPLRDSIGDVRYSADLIDSLATEAPRLFGHVLPTGIDEGRTMVIVEPVGPVAAFTPWNYPMVVPARKVGAALAAGCTMVLKPAQATPASAVALARALQDAGLPDGVLNVVFGRASMISDTLINDPRIRKVSFTGSTGVGQQVAAAASARVKPVMLELGGHAPVIIFDDVDVEAVARDALGAKIHNTGQSCGSPTRFFVHEKIHDAFVEAYGRLLAQVRAGDPFDPETEMGPMASASRFDAMQPLVSDAVERGARLVTGGTGDKSAGYHYAPTLLANVPEDALAMHEEPFGPIAMTTTFTDEADVIARANSLPYGLAAYLFTNDAERTVRLPRLIDAGMVSVNKFGVGSRDTFFGGRKESGYGSEGGPEAVEGYTVKKLISQR